MTQPSYRFLDSGSGERLEQFGDIIIARPSKFAVWERRFPKLWGSAHLRYHHKEGWKKLKPVSEPWSFCAHGATLLLRTQENGQVGVFPEHLSYAAQLEQQIARCAAQSEGPIKVLNLFAYTGFASIVAAKAGAQVTHVDLSKKVLDWARENFTANGISTIRMIREDAVLFLEKEAKRGNKYHIVILDPPSFSRVSQSDTWNLDEVLHRILTLALDVLHPAPAALFATSHHFETGAHVIANLLADAAFSQKRALLVTPTELVLKEAETERCLPAGFLCCGELT
jgi:23S rRNA (cytosine1962-C5)-methyltransferase